MTCYNKRTGCSQTSRSKFNVDKDTRFLHPHGLDGIAPAFTPPVASVRIGFVKNLQKEAQLPQELPWIDDDGE